LELLAREWQRFGYLFVDGIYLGMRDNSQEKEAVLARCAIAVMGGGWYYI